MKIEISLILILSLMDALYQERISYICTILIKLVIKTSQNSRSIFLKETTIKK